MKKILLASTVLVGSTGFAAADVTFSGGAYTGLAFNLTTSTLTPEISANFNAGMMTTTDGGLEAGAAFSVFGGGQMLQKDPGDAEFGTTADWGGGAFITSSRVYLSGSWGRVDVVYDSNTDDNSTTGGDYDITATYTNSWGNFDLAAYGVLAPAASTATTNGDFGAKGTYNFGDYSVWVGYDYDRSNANPNKVSAGATAAISGFTAAAEVGYRIGAATPFNWAASAGYATGPYSISAFVNSDTEYGAEAAYDLGGGVALEAGFAHSNGVNSPVANVIYGGVSMAF